MTQFSLIVDDDRTERRMVASILKNKLNLETLEAESGKACLRKLEEDTQGAIKLVVLDLDMPAMSGLQTLQAIKQLSPALPVIVLTGSTNMDDAVQAMKMGTTDFLSKPVNAERMMISARNALKISLMAREITRLKRKSEHTLDFTDLVGHDGGLASCIKTGRKAAGCGLSVLVSGETGTGKEIFAHAIHGESSRGGEPFIAINCGAIPEKLIESTLFGHEKGAFTGAIARTPGKFLEAHNGTIFLDEIGELSPEAQVKLLRVLQQREIEPVGASRPISVNVRVISATNRDLHKEVQEGRFRQDLFFRLNVLHIHMPPLRDRISDVPALSAHFINAFCGGQGLAPKDLTKEALSKLQEYNWPGNVREFENVINRAVMLSEQDILGEDDFVIGGNQTTERPATQKMILPIGEDGIIKTFSTIEQEIIRIALAHYGNNISRTARALGIAKSTLYTKLENSKSGSG